MVFVCAPRNFAGAKERNDLNMANMKKEYKMSAERKEELQKELTYLKTVREKEVADLIKEARGFGDLSVCFDDFPLPDGLVLPLGSGAVSVAYGTENLGDAAMIWNEDQLICALYASLARRADEIWVKDVKMPPDGGENANLP